MDEKLPPPSPPEQEATLEQERISRRTFMMNVGIALNALVALVIATPVIGYLFGPVSRKDEYHRWVELGRVDDFKMGETRLISFRNPFRSPWDGETANVPAYVRRAGEQEFTVFAINCAHLNCPVRWFAESQLFMCPCHGGVYYADGNRASGPPERGLFTYDLKVEGGKLFINAGQMPTLSNKAGLRPCPQPSGSGSGATAANLVTRIAPCPGTNESTIG